MSQTAAAPPVTIVVQTRARQGHDQAFGHWQARISAAVAEQPGFIEQSVMPPNPPSQTDWVILQRFTSDTDAIAWLRSERRQSLLAEVQSILIGADDVHLVRDPGVGVMPAPVSAVIVTRVKPGQEDAFRAWEQRIAVAQARSPGFQGYRFEPPIPGVQEDWMAILRFDSEPNLRRWLDSPERQTLLTESAAFVDEFHARVVRTGFEQWFGGAGSAAPGRVPTAWKQNMVVLLMLYPVVFLFGLYVQTPWLAGWAGIPFWESLFIGNVVSLVLLNWLVPWGARLLGWWLHPKEEHRLRTNLAGVALMLGLYAVWFVVFSRMS